MEEALANLILQHSGTVTSDVVSVPVRDFEKLCEHLALQGFLSGLKEVANRIGQINEELRSGTLRDSTGN